MPRPANGPTRPRTEDLILNDKPLTATEKRQWRTAVESYTREPMDAEQAASVVLTLKWYKEDLRAAQEAIAAFCASVHLSGRTIIQHDPEAYERLAACVPPA